MTDDKNLSVPEVAKLLSLSKNTIYAMVNRGELNSYRIGRKLRFSRDDINNYIAKSRHETQTAPVKRVDASSSLLNGEPVDAEGFVISGQDVVLDVLTNMLNMKGIHCQRAYVASFESILSLYQDKVQVATTHLWDWQNDDYNTNYVRWLMPGIDATVINLTYRMIGFYVKKGNPLKIHSFEDLAREDVRFLNRRKGSGTRILLDGKLKKLGIPADRINGYENEIGSHLTLASAIAEGKADVAIGTQRVTIAMKDIEFVPIQRERYDMVVKKSTMENPKFQKLLEVLRSDEFRFEIAGISGNDYSDMGKVIAEV